MKEESWKGMDARLIWTIEVKIGAIGAILFAPKV
jgi:hypothetical protein